MMDPLSDVLRVLDARAALSTGLAAGGAWSVGVGRYAGLKFNAVLQGEAWLRCGEGAPLRLRAGDCFMLAGGRPFVVASDPDLAPVDAGIVFAGAQGGVARIGAGDEVRILGGRMLLDPALAPLLTEALPEVVLLDGAGSAAATVRWLLERLQAESGAGAPASNVVQGHLTGMLFVELMRAAARDAAARPGLFGALADVRIARALAAMHRAPALAWTVESLAAEAHMSRSNFAARFRQLAGVAPLDYLRRWRLCLAERALRAGGVPVAAAAALAGYGSESAFGYAFRRAFGRSPRRYAGAADAQGSVRASIRES